MIQRKYYKMVRVSYEDSNLFQIKNITDETGVITVSNSNVSGTLQYSTDGVNFTTAVFTNYTCEIELPAGGNCYFKGTGFNRNSSNANNAFFDCSVNHNVRGNLYSLIDPTNYASATNSYNYMFYCCFNGNTHLVDAGGLMLPVGVTSLDERMFYRAFYGCTSLTTAPDFSNVTSTGYRAFQEAFNGCTSLTTAPDFSGLTSIGYQGLRNAFNGCASLTTAPDFSNVTSIDYQGLNGAFTNCTSLTTAPDLSSVTSLGNDALNSAFQNCTSLTTAPDLSSVTSLGNYALQTAFYGCTHLQKIYAPNIDTWDTGKFNSWVNNAGSQAATPKQMIFQTQALLDSCPSGISGYGGYQRVLA